MYMLNIFETEKDNFNFNNLHEHTTGILKMYRYVVFKSGDNEAFNISK